MTHDEQQMIPAPEPAWRSRPAGRSAGLIALFGLLTLAFTYPAWTAPDTLLHELADVRFTAWALAWDAHALVRDPGALFDANAFFPYRDALAFSENFIGTAAWVAPFNWAGHPILAYNVAMLASFVLAGVGTALWVGRLTDSLAAGVAAGVMWGFAPARMDHLSHLHILSAFWIPFAMLALTRYAIRGRRIDAIAAAALLAMQYASGLNMALIALPFAVLYVALLLLTAPALPPGSSWRRIAVDGSIGAAILAAVAVPLSLPYLRVRQAFGFERAIDEMIVYSAQLNSYLSPGRIVQAPHMKELFAANGLAEANYFPGFIVAALGIGALLVLLPMASRGHWPGSPAELRRPATGADLLAWAHRAAIAITAAAGLLHAAGLTVAYAGSHTLWGGVVLQAHRGLRPTVWLAVAGAAALACWRPARSSLRARAFAILAYLAMLAYVLSFGPMVRSWGVDLGDGPYRILYEVIAPYRSIRSVGRFGIEWALLWAALAAMGAAAGLDAVRRRLAGRRHPNASWVPVALSALLVAAIAWECRTWPTSTIDARVDDPEIYEYLATLPPGSTVLHVPVYPSGESWRTTEYMLGSLGNWLPIVNGYSGFEPRDLVALANLDPFSQEFVDRLRWDYPVDYVVFHGGKLSGHHFDELGAPMLLQQRPDLVLEQRLVSPRGEGHALVFRLRRDREVGATIRRRYAAAEFAAASAMEMEARLGRRGAADWQLQVVWEGVDVRGPALDGNWTPVRIDRPATAIARADGTARVDLHLFRERPLGGTGASLERELLLDVQDRQAALALDDVWERANSARGVVVFEVLARGQDLEDAVVFDEVTGIAALNDFIDRRPPGRVLALAINPRQPMRVDGELAAALQRLGAGVETGDLLRHYALAGAVGAAPGTAVEDENVTHAAVRVGPAPIRDVDLMVRRLRLVPGS